MRTGLFRSIVALAVIPGAVRAAEPISLPNAPPLAFSDWTITLGAEGRFEPQFAGRNQEIFRPYPLLDVRRAGIPERFRAPRDGTGFGILEGSNLQVGPVAQAVLPRNETDNGALRGLGDVDWAIEVGIFAEYWWTPSLRTRAEIRQGFLGHHGMVSDLTTDLVFPATGRLTLSGGPRVTFASTGAIAPYFGIDSIQSAASSLPVFNARGGFRSIGAGTQARYHWTPEWATYVFVEYERLTGDAEDSPLVQQRGSPNQTTLGFGVTRSFNVKVCGERKRIFIQL